MNVANDKLWAKVSFALFLVTLGILMWFVNGQSAEKLQVNPLSDKIDAKQSHHYYTSGIVQSISEQERYTYVRVETFCTVTGKYDTLLKPDLTAEIGDFVTITGTVETFKGKSLVSINNLN